MICYDCAFIQNNSEDIKPAYGVALCSSHFNTINETLLKLGLPKEVAYLYYALKKQGLKPFIGWWNGTRFIPIALSRTRINIEIEDPANKDKHLTAMEIKTHQTQDYNKHFMYLQIPLVFIENHLEQTAAMIYEINEGLKHYEE